MLKETSSPSGFLIVNKPAGITSHDVVDRLRGLFRLRRIGHAGTLDPCARGVLVAGIGNATKKLSRIQITEKEYEAEMTFGYSTDTQDFTGKKIEEKIPVRITRARIEKALESFSGEIKQITPAYSAVRHEGKHFYELARNGQDVPKKERSVTVYEIGLLSLTPQEPYTKAGIYVKCSTGTYIRALCEDIGKALGYPAHMSALTRTAVGTFRLSDALDLHDLSDLSFHDRCAKLIPLESVVQ